MLVGCFNNSGLTSPVVDDTRSQLIDANGDRSTEDNRRQQLKNGQGPSQNQHKPSNRQPAWQLVQSRSDKSTRHTNKVPANRNIVTSDEREDDDCSAHFTMIVHRSLRSVIYQEENETSLSRGCRRKKRTVSVIVKRFSSFALHFYQSNLRFQMVTVAQESVKPPQIGHASYLYG